MKSLHSRLANSLRLVAALAVALACAPAQAFDSSFSGFGSLAAGRTFGPCDTGSIMAPQYASACTRFVADWGQAGVNTPSWSINAESRLGLQWTGTFNSAWSATVQGMLRRTLGPTEANLEWAYLTYKINPSWTLQVGRKRLPLFYYSDFQDIGYAYTMVRPAPDVYGWEIVNYNGINLDYTTNLGDWSIRASAYGGSETNPKTKIFILTYGKDDLKEVRWRNMAGFFVEASKDWFSARVGTTRTTFSMRNHSDGTPVILYDGTEQSRQSMHNAAVQADYGNWLVRAEYGISDRSAMGFTLHSNYLSVGRRFGAFTPMAMVSSYRERSAHPTIYNPLLVKSKALALRYEVNKWSALKVQVDHTQDISSDMGSFVGDSTNLTVSYDFVF